MKKYLSILILSMFVCVYVYGLDMNWKNPILYHNSSGIYLTSKHINESAYSAGNGLFSGTCSNIPSRSYNSQVSYRNGSFNTVYVPFKNNTIIDSHNLIDVPLYNGDIPGVITEDENTTIDNPIIQGRDATCPMCGHNAHHDEYGVCSVCKNGSGPCNGLHTPIGDVPLIGVFILILIYCVMKQKQSSLKLIC